MTNNGTLQRDITIQGQKLETVDHFKYLDAIICDEGSRREVLSRAAQTMAALARLKIIWKDENIRIKHKIRLMRALVMTIFLYACETWTLTAELQRRIQALEFRCFRKILGISYKDRVTNEHVRETIVKHIGQYEDLLATVKRRKLKWYGHVTRSKVILQGTVEEGAGRKRAGVITSQSGPANPSLRLRPWHTTGRSGENWRGSPSWRAPTAPRGAKGPRQGKANTIENSHNAVMNYIVRNPTCSLLREHC